MNNLSDNKEKDFNGKEEKKLYLLKGQNYVFAAKKILKYERIEGSI